MHTGERPFVCDHPGCSAAFAAKSSLHAHTQANHTPEGIARQKKQEQRIARALEAACISFKRERVIDFRRCVGSGTWARIDFVLDLCGHVVLLEVDENQHSTYYSVESETARMAKAVESLRLGGCDLPITFVRYNPHAFRIGGTQVKVEKTQREAKLIEALRDEHGPFYTGQPLSIVYMYYDKQADGSLCVLDSPEYPASLIGCVAHT